MNTPTALRSAGRIKYAVLRVPLRVVDEQVVQRFLRHDSAARRTFEQALDGLDEAAGRWLREPERADKPPTAEKPRTRSAPTTDTDATTESSAEPVEAEEPDQSADRVDPVEEEQIEHLTDELLEDQQSETFVGELAEDDELRRVQAELNAKRLVEEQRDEQD